MEKQYLLIEVEQKCYGIDLNYVENVIRLPKITRVPGSQPYYKGIIHLRGILIPVMSLRLRMGFSDGGVTKDSRIVVLNWKESEAVGLLVDRVGEIAELSEEDFTLSKEIDRLDFEAVFGGTK